MKCVTIKFIHCFSYGIVNANAEEPSTVPSTVPPTEPPMEQESRTAADLE